MKIVYVCNEYPPHVRAGGIGVFTHTIAHGLVERGHDVTVVGYGKSTGQWQDQGVTVVILPESTTRGVAWYLNRRRLYRWLKNAARAGAIDIVEIPESHGLVPFSFKNCPVVVRLHLNTSTMARNAGRQPRWLLRRLEKKTLCCHRHWIAVSRYILETTISEYAIKANRFKVVYNPIGKPSKTVKPASGIPQAFILYAGTLSDRKGAYVLAEAAKSFLPAHPELHLLYVGGLTVEDGRRADETIRDILGEELATRVHFSGLVEHDVVLACMNRARVFAFPSKLESFGLVPVEAMSCGVPVVYSNLHAGPEIVDDGITGLLANPHSPADVAEKVQRILNNPSFGKQLAKNAQQAVRERFSLQRCIDDTLQFYKESLSEQNI